jgi:phage gpG-like protein
LFIVSSQGLAGVADNFDRMSESTWRRGLMVLVGNLVKKQTEKRISVEKTAPSGAPWAVWAPSTAARRTAAQSLLVYNRQLLSSIFSRPSETKVEVGSPAPYGGFLQDGTDRMVAREFLGLSSSNEDEVSKAVMGYLRSRLI